MVLLVILVDVLLEGVYVEGIRVHLYKQRSAILVDWLSRSCGIDVADLHTAKFVSNGVFADAERTVVVAPLHDIKLRIAVICHSQFLAVGIETFYFFVAVVERVGHLFERIGEVHSGRTAHCLARSYHLLCLHLIHQRRHQSRKLARLGVGADDYLLGIGTASTAPCMTGDGVGGRLHLHSLRIYFVAHHASRGLA